MQTCRITHNPSCCLFQNGQAKGHGILNIFDIILNPAVFDFKEAAVDFQSTVIGCIFFLVPNVKDDSSFGLFHDRLRDRGNYQTQIGLSDRIDIYYISQAYCQLILGLLGVKRLKEAELYTTISQVPGWGMKATA